MERMAECIRALYSNIKTETKKKKPKKKNESDKTD